jgi:7,8-dihydropterin-6-yl-methyl-4-(beta-D-ribofuranosyl)aminobenzene 5'-phosphate synthase
MKITILVDDRAGRAGLRPAHGLALWIEAGNRNILFDTGQGGVLENNARVLGVDLETTGSVVLSHGHYDHTGGLARVLRLAPGAHVYGHPSLVLPRYSMHAGVARSIAMPMPALAALQRLPETRLHWLQQPFLIADGIGLSGPIPRITDDEDSGEPFYLDSKGLHPDPLDDDLAIWLQSEKGLVVCVGCAHAGLVNTLHHIRNLNKGQKIRAVIGGFHLGNSGPRRLQRTIAALLQLEPERVVPCHCTGEQAVAALRQALGERAAPGAAGLTLQF